MVNKKAVMLIGLPASGKSTLRKQLVTEHSGFKILSSDDNIERIIKEEYPEGTKYSDVFKDVIQRANTEFEEDFKKYLDSDKDIEIIIDRTNLTKKGRGKLISRLRKSGFGVCGVVFLPSNIKWLKMFSERNDEGEKYIPFNVAINMAKTFEMPTEDEGFDFIEGVGDMELDDMREYNERID